ncbi:MAG: sigma-70 family RNA polymerase sigma factor [Planctomycetota bacterium]
MQANSGNCGLTLELAWSECTVHSQRWILSAMHRQGQRLVTMLWRILGNEQDVCDAYQQVFLQLAHYQGGLKPANIEAYLFRTAGNTAISILRRRKLDAASRQEIVRRKSTPRQPDYAHELDSMQLQQRLRDCVARLPAHLQNVVLLRDLGELSYAHVARILGISAGAARVYRRKALVLLSNWMCDENSGY